MSHHLKAPVPPVFRQLAGSWWKLQPSEVNAWWSALSRATWSRATTLRADLLLLDSGAMQLDASATLHGTLNPQRLIKALEALVHEACLQRRQANAIERCLLVLVGADGAWITTTKERKNDEAVL